MIKPVVNSWDVFDTLLTRFSIDPMQVFALIDRRHPGLEFGQRRLAAQAALDRLGRPYVIYDIYRQMAAAGMAAEAARGLLKEELATELSLMLPVRSAVEQVAPNDLLVSDMYLPGEIIGAWLAEICDLHGALPVIRSNWGKHSGTLWPKILAHYVIRTHYGDNPNSDEAAPRKFGINTVLLREVEPTDWEKKVARLGLGPLALILRETRLRSLRRDAGIFERLAAGPYIALLLGYAGYLAEVFGAAPLAFLSRDCDDLGRIFRAIFPEKPCLDLDLSRRMTKDPGNDGFFRAVLPAECVLVDGVSSGRSVAAMQQRMGSGHRFSVLLFLDHLLPQEAVAASPVQWKFKSSEFGGRHHPLELLSQSPYPPVARVEADAASGGWVKAFGAAELSAPEAAMIRNKCETVTNFLRAIRLRGVTPPTPAQNLALMRMSLEAILDSETQPALFPSFVARERFAPF